MDETDATSSSVAPIYPKLQRMPTEDAAFEVKNLFIIILHAEVSFSVIMMHDISALRKEAFLPRSRSLRKGREKELNFSPGWLIEVKMIYWITFWPTSLSL